MNRGYTQVLIDHFQRHRQMLFLAGPRQVGKTTLAQQLGTHHGNHHYVTTDHPNDRALLLDGYEALLKHTHTSLTEQKPLLIIDEMHKLPDWKDYLKGLFDRHQHQLHLLVTGSARLDVLHRGGDSLLGRYFVYHIHPLSVAEVLEQTWSKNFYQPPKPLEPATWQSLIHFGGFPEPFLKGEEDFTRQWQQRKATQMIYEDIASLTQIRDLATLDQLATLLTLRVGGLLNIDNLSKQMKINHATTQGWLDALELIGYGFRITPWHTNVRRALTKHPKWYLYDWSLIQDPGARFENLVACHLYKATQCWNDAGWGQFNLHFIRDKDKREVDFVICRDQQPWMLIEAKTSHQAPLSAHLRHFHDKLSPKHSFQITQDAPYVNRDCFEVEGPIIVPALTLLSQLC